MTVYIRYDSNLGRVPPLRAFHQERNDVKSSAALPYFQVTVRGIWSEDGEQPTITVPVSVSVRVVANPSYYDAWEVPLPLFLAEAFLAEHQYHLMCGANKAIE